LLEESYGGQHRPRHPTRTCLPHCAQSQALLWTLALLHSASSPPLLSASFSPAIAAIPSYRRLHSRLKFRKTQLRRGTYSIAPAPQEYSILEQSPRVLGLPLFMHQSTDGLTRSRTNEEQTPLDNTMIHNTARLHRDGMFIYIYVNSFKYL
jgi:hypothetical protein